MANGRPLLSAYRAMMSGRLIGLDKCPGVRPVDVGETWRRMLKTCVLVVTGEEDKKVYGTEKLCGGLEARIEGGIHVVQLLW